MAYKKETDQLEETVVKINRCTNVTKGGKSMSFSALVVVGDKNGTVGYGFGKAREVPNAVGKAVKMLIDILIRYLLLMGLYRTKYGDVIKLQGFL